MPRIALSPKNFPAPGRLVDIGAGCRLHVRVSGAGTPPVLLEAGIAATSLSWALVEPELAKFTTVVTYDRGGLGWSDSASSPRTPANLARELKRALEQLGLGDKFVLVGHSFGALVVRAFAREFAAATLGLVLVDPLDPADWCPVSDERRRMLARGVMLSRRGAVLARWGVVRASLSFLLSGNRFLPKLAARLSSGPGGSGFTERIAGEIRKLPRELWPSIAFHWSQAKNFQGMARHLEDLPASAVECSAAAENPSLPVTILLAPGTRHPAAPPSWRLRVAARGGHWLQLDQPELVVSAVREMVERWR